MGALLVTADLMTTSQAIGAASRAEVALESAPPDKAIQAAEESKPSLIAIDLLGIADGLGSLVAALKDASPDAVLIAFGPHVQEARLASAIEAGCDQVITRGQFHRGFDTLLTEHASSS